MRCWCGLTGASSSAALPAGPVQVRPGLGALARFDADVNPDSIFGCGGQVSGWPGKGNVMGVDAAGDSFVLATHAELSPPAIRGDGVKMRLAVAKSSRSAPSLLNPSKLAFARVDSSLAKAVPQRRSVLARLGEPSSG